MMRGGEGYQERLAAAGREYLDGGNAKAVVSKYGISIKSLYRHFSNQKGKRKRSSHASGDEGATPAKKAQPQQTSLYPRGLFSQKQEREIAAWAIGQSHLGLVQPHIRFNDIAQRILLAEGEVRQVGVTWCHSFVRRHTDLMEARDRIVGYLQTKEPHKDNIGIFFDRLDAPEVRDIPRERFYTCDEIGYGQLEGQAKPVISDAEGRTMFSRHGFKGTWITFYECVSGAGKALSPLLIFQDTQVQTQEEDSFDGWKFRISPRGWTSLEVGMLWLEDIFIPHIRSEHGEDEWVVLLCEDQGFHTKDDILWLCFVHKIWIVHYGPNLSLTQPLNISTFPSLRKRLEEHRDSQTVSLNFTTAQEAVLRAYKQARKDVMTTDAIVDDWRATGIFPRDITVPLSSPIFGSTEKEVRLVARRSTLRRPIVRYADVERLSEGESEMEDENEGNGEEGAKSLSDSDSSDSSDSDSDSDSESSSGIMVMGHRTKQEQDEVIKQLQGSLSGFQNIVKVLTDSAKRIAELEARVKVLEAGGTKKKKKKTQKMPAYPIFNGVR